MVKKALRSTALLRSICFVFVLVCILFFILPHDCCGEDCPLCALKNIFSETFVAASIFGISLFIVYFLNNFTYFLNLSAFKSLVSLKVKLSN